MSLNANKIISFRYRIVKRLIPFTFFIITAFIIVVKRLTIFFLIYNLTMTNKIDFTKPWTSPERYRAYKDYTKGYVTALTDTVNTSHTTATLTILNQKQAY